MQGGTKVKRIGVIIGAALVGMMAAGVFGNAAVTFTAPNASSVSFSLSPGGTSNPINPPADTGVLLMGITDTASDFSEGSITLIHIAGKEIRWSGLESPPTVSVVGGSSTTPGRHVVYLDHDHKVDVEILSADEIVVHNSSSTTQTGKVKLIW